MRLCLTSFGRATAGGSRRRAAPRSSGCDAITSTPSHGFGGRLGGRGGTVSLRRRDGRDGRPRRGFQRVVRPRAPAGAGGGGGDSARDAISQHRRSAALPRVLRPHSPRNPRQPAVARGARNAVERSRPAGVPQYQADDVPTSLTVPLAYSSYSSINRQKPQPPGRAVAHASRDDAPATAGSARS